VALVAAVALAGCSGGAVDQGGAGGPLQEPGGAREGDAAAQGGGAPGSPQGGSGQPSGGGPGAPGNQGNQGNGGGAVPAPINIPEFQQIGAGNLDQIRGQIEGYLRDGCRPRGELCIRTVVERRGDSHMTCFGGTDPDTSDGGAVLDPRKVKVFVIYSGSNPDATPCEPQETGPGSSESTGSSGSTGSTGSTGASESAPEESTPPEENQPPPSSS
jgi:hypothetical protein